MEQAKATDKAREIVYDWEQIGKNKAEMSDVTSEDMLEIRKILVSYVCSNTDRCRAEIVDKITAVLFKQVKENKELMLPPTVIELLGRTEKFWEEHRLNSLAYGRDLAQATIEKNFWVRQLLLPSMKSTFVIQIELDNFNIPDDVKKKWSMDWQRNFVIEKYSKLCATGMKYVNELFKKYEWFSSCSIEHPGRPDMSYSGNWLWIVSVDDRLEECYDQYGAIELAKDLSKVAQLFQYMLDDLRSELESMTLWNGNIDIWYLNNGVEI